MFRPFPGRNIQHISARVRSVHCLPLGHAPLDPKAQCCEHRSAFDTALPQHAHCSRHVTTQWPRKHQCQSPENAVRLKVWHHHHISHISCTGCEPSCVSTSDQIVEQHALQKILKIDTNAPMSIQTTGIAMAGRKAAVAQKQFITVHYDYDEQV